MSSNNEPAILQKSIAELNLSSELRLAIKSTNLKEFLDLKTHEMLEVEGFGYRELKELYQFLEDNNSEDWIKEF